MITTRMRTYDCFALGETEDAYGERVVSENPIGSIKMSITFISNTISESAVYADCEYLGLTYADIKDTYVIQYGEDRLKVKYVIPQGRYKQVFLARA